MSGENKYKYAIVRLPETSVVDFFSLIVSKGYSDVSFVSSLSQCSLRDDPNDEPTTSSAAKDVNDDDSTSENNKTSPARRPSNSVQFIPQVPVKSEALENTSSVDMLQAVPADFLSNLFGKNLQADFDISPTDWNDLKLSNGESSSHSHDNHFKPYSSNQKSDIQTRMKGWQREYIKEVINNGHYPTEEELRDIEQKCDLSRKQVLRFIAKRLVNPNRKPRVNHFEERRMEQEMSSSGSQKSLDSILQKMNSPPL